MSDLYAFVSDAGRMGEANQVLFDVLFLCHQRDTGFSCLPLVVPKLMLDCNGSRWLRTALQMTPPLWFGQYVKLELKGKNKRFWGAKEVA